MQNLPQIYHYKTFSRKHDIEKDGNRTFRPFDVSPPGRFAPSLDVSPPGRFATWTFRPLDVSPLGRFAPSMDVSPPTVDVSPPSPQYV